MFVFLLGFLIGLYLLPTILAMHAARSEWAEFRRQTPSRVARFGVALAAFAVSPFWVYSTALDEIR